MAGKRSVCTPTTSSCGFNARAAVAMPLIAVWTTIAALFGGMLAADLAIGLSPAYFVTALPKAVELARPSADGSE